MEYIYRNKTYTEVNTRSLHETTIEQDGYHTARYYGITTSAWAVQGPGVGGRKQYFMYLQGIERGYVV